MISDYFHVLVVVVKDIILLHLVPALLILKDHNLVILVQALVVVQVVLVVVALICQLTVRV